MHSKCFECSVYQKFENVCTERSEATRIGEPQNFGIALAGSSGVISRDNLRVASRRDASVGAAPGGNGGTHATGVLPPRGEQTASLRHSSSSSSELPSCMSRSVRKTWMGMAKWFSSSETAGSWTGSSESSSTSGEGFEFTKSSEWVQDYYLGIGFDGGGITNLGEVVLQGKFWNEVSFFEFVDCAGSN